MKQSTNKIIVFALISLIAINNLQAQMLQLGPKKVPGGAVGAALNGFSVAINFDGTTAVTGAQNDANFAGAAFVYTRNVNTWSQQGTKLVASDAIGDPSIGTSTAISNDGKTILVGGPADNGSTGAAWVFTRTGTIWSQQAKLIGTAGIGATVQGISVALSDDGNTAAVGGYFDNLAVGAVWIFTRSGSTWTQQQKLVGTASVGQSAQGSSVSLSGDGNTVAFGGPGDNDQLGAVWVFTRSAGVWSQQGNKIVPTGQVGATVNVGCSISLSGNGDVLAFGGRNDNNNSGAAWVYTRTAGVWTQDGNKIIGVAMPLYSYFGSSVSLVETGNKLIIGGSGGSNVANTETGAAYLFTKISGTWTQEGTRMVGTGNTGFSNQGGATAISGNGRHSIVGGIGDNSGTGAAWFYKVIPNPIRGNMTSLDGINDCITIAHTASLKPSTNITVEAWVKANNITSTTFSEIARKEDGDSRFLLSFQNNGTILSFGLGVGGSYSELDVNITASNYTNKWVHVAAVYNGTQKIIYVNGVVIGTQNVTGAISTAGTSPLFIGASSGSSEFLNGSIEEFRFWNTARTQGQIRENLHITLSGDETGLVAYYQFNETTGNTKDLVQSNHGVMTNGASRVASTVSVSGGKSQRITVTINGLYNFNNVDCLLGLTEVSYPHPNDDIVVSKLNGTMVGTQPTGTLIYDSAYWVISNYGINSGLNVYPIFILGAGYISIADAASPENLKLNKRSTNSAGAFTQINALSSNTTTGQIDFDFINSFSEFAVSTIGNSILPIKLISFTGQLQNNNASLNWIIGEAEISTTYELQRSVTAQNFATINTQLGNAISKNFTYNDNSLTIGNYYYRLKITNANGEVQYSKIVLLKLKEKVVNVTIYPNPIKVNTAIQLSTNAIVQSWKLINATGQVVASKNNIRQSGAFSITLANNIKAGTYQLQLQTNKGTANEKLLIQ